MDQSRIAASAAARSSSRVRTLVLASACLAAALTVVASPAGAATRGAPWDGGYGYVSPIEQRFADIATLLSNRAARAYCNSAEQWRALGMDDDVVGFVPASASSTASFMQVSPFACSYGDRFLAHPQRSGQKTCARTQVEARRRAVTVRRLLRIHGRVVRRLVTVWRKVRVRVIAQCGDYLNTIISIETIAHEAMHLYGFQDEAKAECLGMQLSTVVAYRLGADPAFAYEIGKDYVPYYVAKRADLPEYWSADCRDGGRLDLWRDQAGWPTPLFSSLDGVRVPSPGG
jgi:hypothetical protein